MAPEPFSADLVRADLHTMVVGARVLYLQEATSTMDIAHREAEAGAPEGTVVIAEAQSAGRGRFQRPWLSRPGENLTLSVVLRPGLEAVRRMNMAVCLSVVRAVRSVAGLSPTVKWPNDIRLGGRKVCGILIESRLSQERLDHVVAGIGLNANSDPALYPEIAGTATSLMLEAGGPVSRLRVCREVLRELDRLYAAARRGDPSIRGEWRGLLETLGRRVQVRWAEGDGVEEGVAADVDEEGNLLLSRPDGSTIALVAGEVTLQA